MSSLSLDYPSSRTVAGPDPEDVGSHNTAVEQSSHRRLLLNRDQASQQILDFPYRGNGTPEDPYVVGFLENDTLNPLNLPPWRKWTITILQAFAVLAVAFASTAYSSSIPEIMDEFDVSNTVATLGITMFVLGFAFGPVLWAPLSELYGRQGVFVLTYMALAAFNAGTAAAPNMPVLIAMRTLAGTFGSSPLTNAGGVIADMFPSEERGTAMSVFAMAPFLGPSIGPIIAGFLTQSAGWRWVAGLMACSTGALWIAISLSTHETYAPVILRRRAHQLSKAKGKVYVSKLDIGQPKKTMVKQFKIALSRPWTLLFTEPIVMFLSLYVALIYGTLYMMFAAFPIVFQQQRGWSQGIGGLAFLGILTGVILGVCYCIYDARRYLGLWNKAGSHPPPEARLPPAILGSVLIPIGLFWFAWTNDASIHWIVPIIGSSFFGCGQVLVFLSSMNYLIDSYVIYAASVLAANSILRSIFGAVFPLFTSSMYKTLGIHWAASVPAFLSVVCLPFPLLFYKYGAAIRMKCKFSAKAANLLLAMHDRTEPGGPATA